MKKYKRFRVDVSPIHEVFGDNPITDKKLFEWWNKWMVDLLYDYQLIQGFREFIHENSTGWFCEQIVANRATEKGE
jgi:hypothetical protein